MNAPGNTTNSSVLYEEYTSVEDYTPLLSTLWRVWFAGHYLAIAFGIVLNLWLLLAILTSRDIRARMRNKIICSFCVLYLLNCLLFTPIKLETSRLMRLFHSVSCYVLASVQHVLLMQDFISNWTLVLLVIVFIAQICDYEPCAGFKRSTIAIGTYALLALPWIASLVTIPGITVPSFYSHMQSLNVSYFEGCIFATPDAVLIIKSLDTLVPLLVAAGLLAAAVALRRRRFTRGFSSGMQVELLDRGPEVDDHFGYTAAVVVTSVCDLANALSILELFGMEMTQRWIYTVVAIFLSETKVFLAVLPWLLFPDIRERIKTWRPWRCAKPGIDLTFVFKNVHT